MSYLRVCCLTIMLLFPIVMMGRHDDVPVDSLCALWITECNKYILNQDFDKAEKCIIDIENSRTNKNYETEVRACKVNLAFFKAMNLYHHGQYEDAIRIVNGGLSYCNAVKDRPQLLKITGNSYVAIRKYETAKSVYENIQEYARKHHLDELYAQTMFWIAKVNR